MTGRITVTTVAVTRQITVKPRYLATFRPGHNFGERRGWRLNEGSIKYDRKHMEVGVCKYAFTSMCI